MTEYIDRQTLEVALNHRLSFLIEEYSVFDHYTTGYSDAVSAVENFPSADAVPVVRCKDCKWFADNNDGEWYGCQMFQVVRITPEDAPKPDDFCSYGERREE